MDIRVSIATRRLRFAWIRTLTLLIGLAATSSVTLDYAHAQGMLRGSTPADGATVGAPDRIVINFAHPMRLTGLRLSTLTGEVIPVDIDLNGGVVDTVSVPVSALAPDDYTVEWRATGDDGHVMSGAFSFTVSDDPAAHHGGHDRHEGGHHGRHHGGDHWNAPDAAQTQSNPVAVSAEGLSRSRKIYQENCKLCHGANGAGDGPAAAGLDPKPADLRIMAKHHPPGDLAWKITHGRNAMPGWGATYDETTIWELVNFLREEIAGVSSASSAEGHDHHHD